MEWTIGELVEHASTVLTPDGRLNGRVRDVPNERLVRWYATIGLLDPPLSRRGRVALYGRRHLLQLVAVKRRQAEGRSIAEIQVELAGATDRALEEIARLRTVPDAPAALTGPAGAADRAGAADQAGAMDRTGATAPAGAARAPGVTGAPARPRFWTDPPAPDPGLLLPDPGPAVPAESGATGVSTADPDAADPGAAGPADHEVEAAVFSGGLSAPGAPVTAVPAVRLAPGVTLLLDGAARPLSDDDLAAIGAASRALVSALRMRELAPPEGNHR
ncbi:MerR family transcriptional regulator [Planobispora takensis]|uniref:HTH merR-type domain-containing protein n=1 Tax=Planobispora takensis TaxID=1367882 RepID=A0A8J3T037_9ACTN|nr:MerR family transcriptional regulator [Planobispora takensis]GII01981.1 hypothetical protein Pta02_39890 [Planobispora takensis]